MASAIVASTSATTTTTTTTTPSVVARSDDSNLENSMGLQSDCRMDETQTRDEKKDCNPPPSHNEQPKQEERIQTTTVAHSEIREECATKPSSSLANNQLLARRKLVASSTNSGNAFGEGPLPRELRRIILEVAKTGKCSWLSWNHESIASTQTQVATAKGNALDTKPAAKSPKTLASTSSSSQSQAPSPYSPLLASKTGGIVRKQTSLGATRRSAGLPPRKRHRNGERMRFGNADGTLGRSNASSNSRKRPLVMVRTNSSTASSIASAPSSVGSDYDSAPYECDSEGTSASEFSSARKTTTAKLRTNPQGAQIHSGVETWTDTATVEDNSVDGSIKLGGSPYKTLQMAFRGALGLVLDHFYQNRGNGYLLSPAEKRRNERIEAKVNKTIMNDKDASRKLSFLLSSEYVFQQRRQRLMAMLLPKNGEESAEPPFTIQRIAEVLVAPDRVSDPTIVKSICFVCKAANVFVCVRLLVLFQNPQTLQLFRETFAGKFFD